MTLFAYLSGMPANIDPRYAAMEGRTFVKTASGSTSNAHSDSSAVTRAIMFSSHPSHVAEHKPAASATSKRHGA